MSTNFPTSLDSYAALVDNTDNIVAAHPNDRGDAIETLEAKVGVDSSAVATAHDYLLTHLPGQAQNWDAGAYEVRALTFESDVATGTAPIVTASTTACTNLNADKVDGQDGPASAIVGLTDTQTLTNKTLTSPDINTGTFNGTIDGNWTAASQTCANLGTVTTCDINGGSIDGVTIGAAAAPTVTNLGSVATCDINGGTIDGVTIGAGSAPTVTNLGSVTTCDINGGTINGISSLGCSAGGDIGEFSTDGTLGGNSDTAVPTEKAVKTYVDANSSNFKTGTYTGDGSTDQGITGVGFQPKYVKIWTRDTTDGNTIKVFETTDTIVDDHASGLACQHVAAGGHKVTANAIISLDGDGFSVDDAGSDGHPNTNGQTYNYMCLA